MSTAPDHSHHDHNHEGDDPRMDIPTNENHNHTDAEAGATPAAGTELAERRHDGALYVLRPDSAATPEQIPPQDRTDTPPGGELAPRVYDAEIIDDTTTHDGADGAVVVPVDPPDTVVPAVVRAEADRREVIPSWLRDREELRARIRWALTYAAHTIAFHTVRIPVYAGRLAAHAPRGLGRVFAATYRWVFDTEGKPLRAYAIAHHDPNEYLKLAQLRDDHVRKRLTVALMLVALLATAVTLLIVLGGWGLRLAATAAALGLLGWAGRIPDKPVIGRAVVKPEVAKLTSDSVIAALGGLGIAQINQAVAKGITGEKGISFPAPITREGAGWRADVDLPLGVTAGDVIEKRPKLASGLRRQLGCVWPEPDAGAHEGRLVLWVGDKDMSTAKQPRWPLARAGRVDLFQPVPFGTDQRGRWVNERFMYVSGVIGAIPRMGKTVTLREILLIGALDPRAQLHVYDLKGTGDLSPFEPVAHRYGVGDDPNEIEAAVIAMREVREEMRRRAKVIRSLPDDICPDSRVEPHLVNDTKLGLAPVVIGVDECQVWFEHDTHGKELEDISTDLVKRGPACGIMLFLATQRPDGKSIPTQISANASFRFCLKVMGQTENDMVLGTSSYQNGIRATMFAWGDKGIGYLRGEGADVRIVRTVYTDKPEAKKIVARARLMRHQSGTITGYAAGHRVDTDTIRGAILDDIAAVFDGEDRLWSDVILTRLAELRAGYADWTPDALAAALKPFGVTPKQVAMRDEDGQRRNRRGYRLADITTAITNHHGGNTA